MEARKTPLFEEHVKQGGRMVDFAGWRLPVEYEGLIREHRAVREMSGVFDVSHMGEIMVSGDKAADFVQHIICNDINKMYDGKIIYSPICYENGGIIDDLLVYRINQNKYFIVVNASNTDKDFEWFNRQNKFGVSLKNVSSAYFQLAVQGPQAQSVVASGLGLDLSSLKYFHFRNDVIQGCECIVSRTGYTGEDGFEIYGPCDKAPSIWTALVSSGATPCGLGCRDTLRLEAALTLYGNDITDNTTPLEAGLDIFIKLQKKDFVGMKALIEQKTKGLDKKLTAFTLQDRNIPRHGHSVQDANGNIVGEVTSGTLSPSLGIPIGLAYIKTDAIKNGQELFVNIRKKNFKMTFVKPPFVKKAY